MKLNNKISYIFLGVFLISLILFLLSALSAAVAERLNFGVCQQIRTLLGMVSLPFYPSAFELMIFALPILIVFAVIFVVRTKAHAELKRKFLRAVSVLSLLPSFYIYTLGIAYLSPRIADKVTDNAGYEELCQASYILAERASELSAVAGGALDLQDVRADLSRAYAQLLYGNARGRVALPKTKAAISSAASGPMPISSSSSPPETPFSFSALMPSLYLSIASI